MKIKSELTIEQAIKSGIGSQFWDKGIKIILNQWIEELKNDILFRDDLSTEIRITRRDLLRLQMKSFMDLVSIPETLLEDLKEGNEIKMPILDPYPQNEKQLLEMNNGK